jgi:hypothetical protein
VTERSLLTLKPYQHPNSRHFVPEQGTWFIDHRSLNSGNNLLPTTIQVSVNVFFFRFWLLILRSTLSYTYKTCTNWNTNWKSFHSFRGAYSPLGIFGLPFRGFVSTHTHIRTHGRTPVDEWSAHCRGLYLHRTTQHINTRQTSMPRAAFEPTNPATKLPQTYALNRAATWIVYWKSFMNSNLSLMWEPRVSRATSNRYSTSCHTFWRISWSVFSQASLIRVLSSCSFVGSGGM